MSCQSSIFYSFIFIIEKMSQIITIISNYFTSQTDDSAKRVITFFSVLELRDFIL